MNELDLIKQKYNRGELDSLKLQIQNFLRKNRDKIAVFQKQQSNIWKRTFSVEDAIKYFILHHKTIDMIAEMREQVHKIEEDISQKKPFSLLEEARIKADWIRENAGVWRDNRVLEILYVFNKNPEIFLCCM